MVNEELYQMSQEMGEDPEMLKRKVKEIYKYMLLNGLFSLHQHENRVLT